ncbi:MAG: GTP-binding protein [Pseudodesulfovibrio sp.]|nr:GTP-binding protein [Pseudodesulfovibrio sp.]
MTIIPDFIAPHSSLKSEQYAAPELMKAFIVRSNFIPGVRHRLGWRGVKDCFHDVEAWTAKVGNNPGVFGIRCKEVTTRNGLHEGLFPISYFPHPDEDSVENFSIQAGIVTQRDDYFPLIREYLKHPEMRELFTVGCIRLAVRPDATGLSLSLEAPTCLATIAKDGVSVIHEGKTVQLVKKHDRDQDLHAWDIALEFFRVIAASAAFCIQKTPDSMARYSRNGVVISYDSQATTSTKINPEQKELYLELGFATHPMVPDSHDSERKWLSEPEYNWNEGTDIPEEYASEPWWKMTPSSVLNSLNKNSLGITVKPRLIVLSGFLGSGKTSFLRNMIEYQAARNQFVAIIQNEIGETGLDAKLLGQHYAVTEVDEGCICCSLVGSLKNAVLQITDSFQPDEIVVETTGLANPANLLAEIAEIEDIIRFDSVTTIFDAEAGSKCLDDYEVARNQTAIADVIILNKTDLVESQQIEKLQEKIRKFNPHAPIITAEHGDVHPGLIYNLNDPIGTTDKTKRPLLLNDLRNHSHDHMSSVSIPVPAEFDRKEFEKQLANCPENIFRLKGVVHFSGNTTPSIVQFVAGRSSITPASPDMGETPLFLVAIGRNMDQIDACRLFC